MLAVLGGYDGLREWCLEHPALLNQRGIKSGKNAFERGKVFGHDFFLAHAEERVIHWTIAAEVEDVPSAVLSGRAEISMLEQAGERVATVAYVDPVAIGELAVEGQNEAVRAIGLSPVVALAVVVRQSGNEATGQARGQCGDDAIKGTLSLAAL